MLTYSVVIWGELIDKRESSSGAGEEDIYNGKEEMLVLVSLLDSYSELEAISISISKLLLFPSYTIY